MKNYTKPELEILSLTAAETVAAGEEVELSAPAIWSDDETL